MDREATLRPYLRTTRGAFDLFIITLLNISAFITIVDREPRVLTGRKDSTLTNNSTINSAVNGSTIEPANESAFSCKVANSSQGLYVSPSDACFPLNPSIESYLFVAFPIVMIVACRFSIAHLHIGSGDALDWKIYGRRFRVEYQWWHISSLLAITYVVILLIDISILNGMGLDQTPGNNFPQNITYTILFGYHVGSVATPFGVYALALLPDWIDNRAISDRVLRENLQIYIGSNWRRIRLITTLALTGAVGTTLPFVFDQTNPQLTFLLAIVGTVAFGPLGVVWFLLRRIREAEKKLYPE